MSAGKVNEVADANRIPSNCSKKASTMFRRKCCGLRCAPLFLMEREFLKHQDNHKSQLS